MLIDRELGVFVCDKCMLVRAYVKTYSLEHTLYGVLNTSKHYALFKRGVLITVKYHTKHTCHHKFRGLKRK